MLVNIIKRITKALEIVVNTTRKVWLFRKIAKKLRIKNTKAYAKYKEFKNAARSKITLLMYLNETDTIHWSDKTFLKKFYKYTFNKKLNLKNPRTFNEKLQWIKLYDRNPKYTRMVDKYEAKKYVSEIIGEEYIIPTYGIYDSVSQIDFNALPDKFVIKCTHSSGFVIVCKDKNKLNVEKVKNQITQCLNRDYFKHKREWPYKNVKPRIIIEKFMKNKNEEDIKDYKFFCFNGIPKIMYLSEGSHKEQQRIAFFDMDFKQLNIKRTDYEDFEIIPKKPKTFEKMKDICKKLSRDILQVRVDLYEIDGKIYFGELTFYTGSGYIPFTEIKYDNYLGEMLKLN